MEKIQVLPVYKDTTEKIWLPVNCGDSKMEFAYPPIQGYHAAAYQAMAKDPEIRAARGIELAVLPYAAYTNKQSLWEQIKKKFKARFIQSPHRALLLPKGSLPDKNLEGIIIGTNTKQVRTSMSIPSSFDNWKQDGNIFYTPDKQRYFLPIGTFKFGEHTDDPLEMYLADIYTVAVNLAGVPAISLPAGVTVRDGKKLPVGLQLIGKWFKEPALLDTAEKIERITYGSFRRRYCVVSHVL